eukprot:gene20138-25796_t
MSRIGKKVVAIPSGVTASIDGGQLSVKGPKGTLALALADDIAYEVKEGEISVQPANATKQARAFWGMQRTLVQNLVTGVTDGFTKRRRPTAEVTGCEQARGVCGEAEAKQAGDLPPRRMNCSP